MTNHIPELIIQYGPAGLFILAFGAATLLPFSSEAFLILAITSGISPTSALLSASAGNISGCIFNYFLGRMAGRPLLRRILKSYKGRLAARWIKKWGFWTIPVSWLPIIGDPLLVASGIFRLDWRIFLSGASAFRIIRYVILIELF